MQHEDPRLAQTNYVKSLEALPSHPWTGSRVEMADLKLLHLQRIKQEIPEA